MLYALLLSIGPNSNATIAHEKHKRNTTAQDFWSFNHEADSAVMETPYVCIVYIYTVWNKRLSLSRQRLPSFESPDRSIQRSIESIHRISPSIHHPNAIILQKNDCASIILLPLSPLLSTLLFLVYEKSIIVIIINSTICSEQQPPPAPAPLFHPAWGTTEFRRRRLQPQ